MYKMSYYQFSRQEILQKAKDRCCKEKAAGYYLKNKEAIKERSKNQYKNLPKGDQVKIKKYQRKISTMNPVCITVQINFISLNIKMSLKFTKKNSINLNNQLI